MSILAIDFGGTRIRAAWFAADPDNRPQSLLLVGRAEALTQVELGQDSVIQRLIDTARQVIPADAPIAAIGLTAPGPLDPINGMIHHAETLPGWRNVPLVRILCEAFGGTTTYMQNDANLAALAEYHLGAARGADPAIYLTLSTGIGGGAVIGGELFTGWRGLAIEPGHQRFMMPDGRIVRLEELASGTGIAMLARERLTQSSEPSTLRALEVLSGQAVGNAAVEGDLLARQVIEEAGRWLGLGLLGVIHLFNPQVIVVGGSVSQLGDLLFNPARRIMRANLMHPDFFTEDIIRPAALGDDVCLFGAALYALRQKYPTAAR